MEETCRIAVIGAGGLVGAQHCAAVASLVGPQADDRLLAASGLRPLPESATLACVCQRRPGDTEAASKWQVPQYSCARRMASEQHLDGVVISAPTHLHLPLLEQCIAGARERQARLGLSTLGLRAALVEKPLCEDLGAAVRLVEAAEAAGVSILVGHQRRHSTLVQMARGVVQDAASFGALRGFSAEWALLKPASYFQKEDPRLAWRAQEGKGGPVLINLVHDMDLFRYITGARLSSLFAATSSSARGLEVEDTGAVTMVMETGAVGTVLFTDASPSPWNYEFATQENRKYPPLPCEGPTDCYRFMGEHGSLAFPSLRRYSYRATGQKAAEPGCQDAGREPGWDVPLDLEREQVQTRDPIVLQMQHFVRVCRGVEAPICSGRDALETLAAVEAVLVSARTQLPVRPAELLNAALAGARDD